MKAKDAFITLTIHIEPIDFYNTDHSCGLSQEKLVWSISHYWQVLLAFHMHQVYEWLGIYGLEWHFNSCQGRIKYVNVCIDFVFFYKYYYIITML